MTSPKQFPSPGAGLRIARILIVLLFLALIRTIAELFRLPGLDPQQLRMCISGALTAAIGLFIMVLFSFWRKHLISALFGGITLLLLFLIKMA